MFHMLNLMRDVLADTPQSCELKTMDSDVIVDAALTQLVFTLNQVQEWQLLKTNAAQVTNQLAAQVRPHYVMAMQVLTEVCALDQNGCQLPTQPIAVDPQAPAAFVMAVQCPRFRSVMAGHPAARLSNPASVISVHIQTFKHVRAGHPARLLRPLSVIRRQPPRYRMVRNGNAAVSANTLKSVIFVQLARFRILSLRTWSAVARLFSPASVIRLQCARVRPVRAVHPAARLATSGSLTSIVPTTPTRRQ